MKIKSRLVVLFTLILAGINLFSFLLIYVLSANFREEQFYDRLYEKAINTAKLLIDVKEIDEDLLKIIDENTASLPDEQVWVYNFENKQIYATPSSSDGRIDIHLINEIRLKKRVEFSLDHKEALGTLYEGEYDRFVVIATAFDKYGLGKLNYLKWILVFLFPTSIAVLILAGRVFVVQAFKPINQIIEEVNQITEKSLNSRLDEGNGKDELALLANTFNRMLNRLESAFITQKGFVSYASHELRTPLTAMLGQIEVTLMQSRSKEEYQEMLASINDELLKLKRLTNGLLRLFQLPASEATLKLLPIRIDEVLFHAVDQTKTSPHTLVEIIYVETPEDEDSLIIHGNEDLLILAISNLIENASKFSGGQKVKVYLSIFPNMVTIDVLDSGVGINPDEADKIFEPFYRSKRTSETSGYGIGLALVKQVMILHKAQISLFSEKPGTRVRLEFPRHF
jgi:signal transduction histidine kinase